MLLLAALIFGVLRYHYRDRRAVRTGREVARERYKRNETECIVGFYRPSGVNRRLVVNQKGTPKLLRRILSAGVF